MTTECVVKLDQIKVLKLFAIANFHYVFLIMILLYYIIKCYFPFLLESPTSLN